ncbi:MAG: HWE histidine kinase domain-containing protein [Brevundimonas sp.]
MHQLEDTIDVGAAFDASANAYVLLTSDLVIAAANTAYLELLEVRREDIIGRPMFEAFDSGPNEDAPENVRQVRDSLITAIRTGQRDHLAVVRFSIPHRTPTGEVIYEDRYWSATHTPIKDASGKVAYVLQHTTDITEIEHLRQQVSVATGDHPSALDAALGGGVLARAEQVQKSNRKLESERRKLNDLFMQAPGFIAVLGGPDHVFELANNAYGQLIGHRELIGQPVRDALPEVADQGFIDLLDHVYATGETYEGRESLIQLQRRRGGDLEGVYLNFIFQPIRGEAGAVVGVFVQGHDVTEAVKAEQRQRLMIDELNHRVKNTLATVQSIAIQTARTHENPASFAETFQSRLMALSHTHNLLTRSHWEGADLRDVLQHETLAHGAHRVILNGPATPLPPSTAVSLGMIFHELATNAAKYGALSAGDGRVFVDWSIHDLKDRKLVILWREQGGPAVTEPSRRGFGSRLIERNVRHDLAGEAKLVYASDGFNTEISIPLDRDDGHE